MTDFLLELLSEEIPARMQAKARNDLARLFAECTETAGLSTGAIDVYSTPRRLALIARDVANATQASREELKGPRSNAPEQAIAGFLKKTGLTRDQLEDRDGVLFAAVERAGQPAADILAGAIKRIVADFPWPKSMRWGDGALRWVRPLHGIVALLGEEIVPVEIDGIASGAATVGHRFHHPGPITIGGASDYAEKLRACHVIVDQAEREALIREEAAKAAVAAGLTLLEDEGLVVENAGLTEWPVPLLGRFDADFLDVPREVIVLTMRTNQKYFACTNEEGLLAPAFVCVANIDASDGGEAIAEGNARVLAARLADARFFWEQDLKVPLEEQAKKLGGIVFHEKLGTVADKVERVAKLARWLVEEDIVTPSTRHSREGGNPAGSKGSGTPASAGVTKKELADLVERAARLAKADLVTGMVGEFPELQGVIGGYLAEAQGEPKSVADAIRDHYGTPSEPASVAVAVADKLDSLLTFFAMGTPPSGSKDPFALRRAAINITSMVVASGIRLPMRQFISQAYRLFAENLKSQGSVSEPEQFVFWFEQVFFFEGGKEESVFRYQPLEFEPYRDWSRFELGRSLAAPIYDRAYDDLHINHEGLPEPFYVESFWSAEHVLSDLTDFFADRLKVQQREAGVRHDLIDAVFALGGEDDLVRLLARVAALQSFVETDDGADLLSAYKRAANILKKEKWEGTGASGGSDLEAQEKTLIDVLDKAEPKAAAAIEKEDFTAAMAALASLRGPIDAFFDHVTVNDPDAAKRERRLNLLMRFRDAVNRVADFSRIEG